MKFQWICPDITCTDPAVNVVQFNRQIMDELTDILIMHTYGHGVDTGPVAVSKFVMRGRSWWLCDCGFHDTDVFATSVRALDEHLRFFHRTCPFCLQSGPTVPWLLRLLFKFRTCKCGRVIPIDFRHTAGMKENPKGN